MLLTMRRLVPASDLGVRRIHESHFLLDETTGRDGARLTSLYLAEHFDIGPVKNG